MIYCLRAARGLNCNLFPKQFHHEGVQYKSGNLAQINYILSTLK